MEINDSVRTIAGIGPKRETALDECGILTVGDLLGIYPRSYADRGMRGTLAELSDSPVTVHAIVTKEGTVRRIRGNLSLFVLPVEEVTTDGKPIKGEMVWFNQPWLKGHFYRDFEYYFYGKIAHKNGRRQMYSPQYVPADSPGDFFDLTPIYPKKEGIPPETLKKYIYTVLDANVMVTDDLPKHYKTQYDLLALPEAIENIHRPKAMADVLAGKRRIKFDEALKINMGIMNNRNVEGRSTIKIHNFNQLKRFEANLPFKLTSGQVSVMSDIVADLSANKVMNRLVQGDVGSGKTIIAVACAYLMALSGYQTAYMAPTEILATQHARNFETILSQYGIPVMLLTGSMKPAQRAEVLSAVADGDTKVIIGTHALIQDGIDYYNLGMVITDEQHRFGVKQRGRLGLKGHQPHTLVMSATPIPRTLALVLYGDLDISTIDVLPGGRKKIKTYFYGEKAMPKILDFMEKEMDKGFQTFIVCPFIEENEDMEDVRDIKRVYTQVAAHFKGRYTVDCLYGRMSDAEKKAAIDAYNAKETQLLVATSIIEVGIDVPDVSVITILSADRFGLSQLHQLRGRAGRGNQQAYCFLVSNSRSEKTIERMTVIVNNTNGQKIAEADYQLRGPGDYFGSRQHGFPEFQALDPYVDVDLIADTRRVAEEIFASKQEDMMRYRSRIIESFYTSVSEITMN